MTQGARAFIQAVNDFLFLEDAPEQADILFVPGSRWPGNALRAAELYRQGYAPLVLPSGRFAKAGNRFLGPEEPYQAAYPGPFETEWAYLRQVLLEFPVKELAFAMPKWVTMLSPEHWLQQELYSAVREYAEGISAMRDLTDGAGPACPSVQESRVRALHMGTGCAEVALRLDDGIFYTVLSEETGLDVPDEESLLPCVLKLARVKAQYDRLQSALEEVNATGYGIVMPSMDELRLEEPEIIHQGGRSGVRLKASAPSIHMMKIETHTEVSPIVGSEKQTEELVASLLQEFEEDPLKLWQSNIFGKSLHELVNEGLQAKLLNMPMPARAKMQETLERVINEGCSGLICILL